MKSPVVHGPTNLNLFPGARAEQPDQPKSPVALLKPKIYPKQQIKSNVNHGKIALPLIKEEEQESSQNNQPLLFAQSQGNILVQGGS